MKRWRLGRSRACVAAPPRHAAGRPPRARPSSRAPQPKPTHARPPRAHLRQQLHQGRLGAGRRRPDVGQPLAHVVLAQAACEGGRNGIACGGLGASTSAGSCCAAPAGVARQAGRHASWRARARVSDAREPLARHPGHHALQQAQAGAAVQQQNHNQAVHPPATQGITRSSRRSGMARRMRHTMCRCCAAHSERMSTGSTSARGQRGCRGRRGEGCERERSQRVQT